MATIALVMAGLELVASIAAGVWGYRQLGYAGHLPSDVGAPTQAYARQLSVGNCLGELPPDGTVRQVTVVPCSQTHAARVTGTSELGDVGSTFPGQAQVDALTIAACRTSSPQAAAAGRLVGWAPTQGGWLTNDRAAVCLEVTGGQDAAGPTGTPTGGVADDGST